MVTATKTGIDAARVVQKTAKATEDLIVNKIADKITLIGKSKSNDKTKKQKKFILHQKKDNKLLMTLNSFEHKM